MKLIQMPFSHNCIKVRAALALKKLDHEIQNISPVDRAPVVAASGQGLVPVLVDGSRTIADSTAILLYLDETYPDPPLVPSDPRDRAECVLLEDWADHAFMALSRRIAYWNVTSTPGALGRMFFPHDHGWARRFKERIAIRRVRDRFRISASGYARDVPEARRVAAIAVDRIAGRDHLLDGAPTIADLALASMSAPLVADRALREDPAVSALLAWGARFLPPDVPALYASV
ncbi:MAG TPA: glutathione S-transferase family protein [Candidatus Sulfotelmatobacter sp.]|jgi:glutathione S-transferase|nr:glutathione S-transferase family protein [Candidatus Sulfotelmatobacter sp.]